MVWASLQRENPDKGVTIGRKIFNTISFQPLTLYDAAQFEHDNNKKDENESVVAQSQKVTFIQNQNQKFHHLRAQESSQFLSSLLLNTILLLLKKSPGLEEPRVKLK